MAKYKCKSCKRTFESDYVPTDCPHCGRSDGFIPLSKGGIKIPKSVWLIASAVVALIILVSLFKGCGSSGTATLIPEGGKIKIQVDGISNSKLKKNYKVEVLVDAQRMDFLAFNGRENVAVYDMQRMMVGVMYTFRIVSAKDNKIAEEIKWTNTPQYLLETPPPAPEFATPSFNKERNQDKKEWTVTVLIADTSTADSYAMTKKGEEENGITWQGSNVFVIKSQPGGVTMTIWAKNNSGESSNEIYLEEIKELPKPLTKADIQSVLDGVSSGRISVSTAQEKLAAGNVNLSRTITTSDGEQINTLFDVLMEANGYQTKFVVNGFQNDPNSNKIKSGSLSISIRK